MLQVLVQIMCVILRSTSKVAFAATDGVSSLKLLEKGLPKEHMAVIIVGLTPISIFLPAVTSHLTAGPRPLRVFKWAYVPRLVLGLVFAAFIWSCGQTTTSEGLTFSQYGAMIFCFILHRLHIISCLFRK